jgi:hypothetical protein
MKSSIFVKTSLRLWGSFSLWQGSFNFLLQNENVGVGLVRSKTISRGLELMHAMHVSDQHLSLGEKPRFQLVFKTETACIKNLGTGDV